MPMLADNNHRRLLCWDDDDDDDHDRHPGLTSEGEDDNDDKAVDVDNENDDEDVDDTDSYGSIGCGQRDILCGKDKTYAKHLGNRIFRAAILAFRDLYGSARCKQDKMAITRAVVRRLHDGYGSRFVRFHDGRWEEISDVTARDKVSHALRFSLREAGTTPADTAAAAAAGGPGRGGGGRQRRQQQQQRMPVRKLPERTFSLQLVDPALRRMAAKATTAAKAGQSSSGSGSGGGTRRATSLPHVGAHGSGVSDDGDDDDDDNPFDKYGYEDDIDDDDEAEAAETLRRCQVLIFQSLRLDDPLEGCLRTSALRTAALVRQAAAV
jgi:hypothetical protein